MSKINHDDLDNLKNWIDC
jgi:hypothetical protein